MKHDLISLSQNDPRWQAVKLGSSELTLGQAGCYVTSFCVMASYYGRDVLPPVLNSMIKQAGLFYQGALINGDDVMSKLDPTFEYVKSYYFPNATATSPSVPANLALLQSLMQDPDMVVIVCIDLGNGQVHFTPVIDCDGVNVTIMNVWNGKVEDVRTRYGDPKTVILRYVVYHGKRAQIVPAPPPGMDNDQLRLDRDTNYNLLVAVLNTLGIFLTDSLNKFEGTKLAISNVNAMQQRLQAANDELTQLKASNQAQMVASGDNPLNGLPPQAKQNLLLMNVGDFFKMLFGKGGGK